MRRTAARRSARQPARRPVRPPRRRVRPVLLDTNALSELVRPRPDPHVAASVGGVALPLISVLSLHELTDGAARSRDPARRPPSAAGRPTRSTR